MEGDDAGPSPASLHISVARWTHYTSVRTHKNQSFSSHRPSNGKKNMFFAISEMPSKTFVMVLKKTSWSIPILGSQSSDTINFVTYSLFPSKGEFHVINDFVKRFSDIKRLISNMRELNSGALFFLRDLHPCCSLKQPYFVNFANDWMTKTGGFSYYYFADFRVKKSLYALALQ